MITTFIPFAGAVTALAFTLGCKSVRDWVQRDEERRYGRR